jgi:hypothetical protein
MLTVADYRKRADDCMSEAERASDQDGKFQWRVLGDLWRMLAQQSDGENRISVASPSCAIED